MIFNDGSWLIYCMVAFGFSLLIGSGAKVLWLKIPKGESE